jgi:hypothetical protein
MSKYIYKDIELEIVERSITIGGLHRIVLKSSNGSLVNVTSKKSLKLDRIVKNIENNYEQIKRLIS